MTNLQKKYIVTEKESLANKAYEEIEEMIITLKLKPGEVVSQAQLSEMLEIGKMPIREALKRLEKSHLLTIIPRRGIRIKEIKFDELLLQMEVRRPLEKLIVKRAVRFADKNEKKQLLELADDYEKATKTKDDLAAVRIDNYFNKFIAECARNKFAWEALAPLHSLARRIYYKQYNLDEKLTKKINSGHIKVMKAIASGNEEKALEELEYLLNYIEKLYHKNLYKYSIIS